MSKKLTKGLAKIQAANILGVHINRIIVEERPDALTKEQKAEVAKVLETIDKDIEDLTSNLKRLVDVTDPSYAVAKADSLLFDCVETGEGEVLDLCLQRCRDVREITSAWRKAKKDKVEAKRRQYADRCSIGIYNNIGGLGIDIVEATGDTWNECLDKIKAKKAKVLTKK